MFAQYRPAYCQGTGCQIVTIEDVIPRIKTLGSQQEKVRGEAHGIEKEIHLETKAPFQLGFQRLKDKETECNENTDKEKNFKKI